MDEQPATKRQRTLPGEEEGPLNTELKALATALKSLSLRVDLIMRCKKELPLNMCDIQSLQAALDKFGRKIDIADKTVSKYKCPECQKGFRRKDRMFLHCGLHHPERKYWKLSCPCPRSFKTLYQCNEHLKSDHLEQYEMEQLLIEKATICSMEPRDTESTTLQISVTTPLSFARPSSPNAKGADTAGEKPEGASGIWDFQKSRPPPQPLLLHQP